MEVHRKPRSLGDSRARPSELTRRDAVSTLLRGAILAHPLSWRALAFGAQVLVDPQERQPFIAGVRRLVDAMAYLGEPFSDSDRAQLEAASNRTDAVDMIGEIEGVLASRSLLAVRINPESRVSVERGDAPPQLVEQGWRAYLVKVRNEAGVTGTLSVESPQARPVFRPSTGLAMAPRSVLPADIADRWLALDTYGERPMEPQLSGLGLEYRIVLLYSRDRGRREAQIGATLEAGTQDVGFRKPHGGALRDRAVPRCDVSRA